MKKRRGAGEGSDFQRADGRWSSQIDLGWVDGKRRRKTYYGATQEEVQKKRLKALSVREAGLPLIVEKQTVQQFMEHWLANSLKNRAKPRAHESFSTISRLHIFPVLGKIQIAKLTPLNVQHLLDHKSQTLQDEDGKVKKKGLSPQTVANIRTVLRSALADAKILGLVTRNVAESVSVPRIPKRKIEPLDPENARGFLKAANGHRFEAIFVTALHLGLRRGEVLGLRWRDIDLDGRSLRVAQSMQRLQTGSNEKGRRTELRATETKTDGSERTIALPDSVVRAIKAHRAHQAEDRLAAGTKWLDNGLAFTNSVGRPIEPIVLHRDYKALLKKAELPTTLRFHDLRHSAATLLLAQGVHPRAIMELLGHSSISVTMNVYGHVLPAMMRATADTMDAVLNG